LGSVALSFDPRIAPHASAELRRPRLVAVTITEAGDAAVSAATASSAIVCAISS
jgi:hypothetical protein